MSSYLPYSYSSNQQSHTAAYLLKPVLAMLSSSTNRCILDVGCGNGWLTCVLLDAGYEVYGIDASESGIAVAREQYPDRFFVQNIDDQVLPEAIRSLPFDTIISTEVIEHLYDPRGYVSFCRKVLQNGSGSGSLILSTPYHGYWKNVALSLSGRMDAHFTALWDGGHIKFWSRKTLTRLLSEQGFAIHTFKGCGRLPLLWKSMLIRADL